MGLAVGYMGTKKYLAASVAEVVQKCRSGPLLDVFSGMCSVGEAIGTNRSVWNNDVQIFASEVATAFFTSKSLPPATNFVIHRLQNDFLNNKAALQDRFNKRIKLEQEALLSNDAEKITSHQSNYSHVGNCPDLESEREFLAKNTSTFPYRLCSITYADGYFSLAQSIEIDSIRYAIDAALKNAVINTEEQRWLVIALCQATLKLSTTTGHFAQHLNPNANNINYIVAQREKSVWFTWIDSIAALSPIGSSNWRRENKAYNEDCLSLLSKMKKIKAKPSVIYADPPYTDDQYSRYYHVWETIVLYDYPTSTNAGRYRPNRFVTPFSHKTKVVNAMRELIASCHEIGSDLILSYPNNGLLIQVGANPLEMLKECYKNVSNTYSIDYQHSTMGGSKGYAKQAVKENIYWAKK